MKTSTQNFARSISAEDTALITICSDELSELVWRTYIDNTNRQFMFSDNAYPTELISLNELLYCWKDDLNHQRPDTFEAILLNLPIAPQETIYLLCEHKTCIRTRWDIFCKNWMQFLHIDKGCMAVTETNKHSVIFGNGKSWYGF
jgi:hypothetical protein